MSAGKEVRLRVALLYHRYGSGSDTRGEQRVRQLATALSQAGHEPCVLASHPGPECRWAEHGVPVVASGRVPEGLLRRRGFATPLTHVPLMIRALARGGYHLAHAFSPPDAVPALAWRRLTDRPAVFTCVETVTRDRVADRRLRAGLWTLAVEHTDAVIAPSDDSRDALWRWLVVEARVLCSDDAAGHERLYRKLIADRPH